MEQPDQAAHAERQAALAQLGHVALSNASLDFIFMQSAQTVCSVLGTDFCGILKRGETQLLLVGGTGWPEGWVGNVRLEGGPLSLSGYTVLQRDPVIVTDLLQETRFRPSLFMLEAGVRSALSVVIDAGDALPWGVIGAHSRKPNEFTPDDIDFLRAIAATLGQAIERRRVEVELRVRAVQQSAIAELGQRLLTSDVDQGALERACELVMDGLGVEFSVFFDAVARQDLEYRAGQHWVRDHDVRVASGESHAGLALRLAQPVVVEDYEIDRRFDRATYLSYGIRSGIAVPVMTPAGNFGVLTAETRTVKRFTAGDVHFMQSMAAVLATGFARERANRELVESEQRFRSVVEGASEIIFSLTPSREVCALNPAFEAITGWRSDEWIGRSFEELIVPEQRPEILALIFSVLAEPRSVRTEMRMRAKRGGEILVAAAVSPKIVLGEVVELYGFARDVTDERRAQADRSRAARELQLVMESTDEGIYATDINGLCTLVNRSAARMLGASRDFLLGADIHALVHPGEHECDIATATGRGRGYASHEDVFHRADGTSFPVEYSLSPIVDAGKIVGSVVAFSDITARKKLEAQLEQANRLTSLGHLAATVAHEFNNVLMGISPFAEVLRREGLSERAQTAVEQISRSVNRGKRITQDILRFTQPAEPVLAVFDANTWIQTVAFEARSLIGSKYTVVVDVPGRPVRILADAGQLHQSLINLIVNARDAMADGGVITLRVVRPIEDERFDFGVVERPERFAHFVVEDTGHGIGAEIVRHIFEPLFTTKKTGTGLGLPVTRHVVKRHGGEIFVESRVGAGTKFHIFIPLADEKSELATAADETAGAVERRYRRILLVEDERSVAAGIAALLEIEGLNVTVIENGRDVPRAIEDTRPDAIILDIGLPDMDGTKVFDAIAREHPDLPVVFSSGHADESKLEKYLAEPHVGFLLKPYDLDALLTTLDRVVS